MNSEEMMKIMDSSSGESFQMKTSDDQWSEVEHWKSVFKGLEEKDRKRYIPTITDASLTELIGTFIEMLQAGIVQEKWTIPITLQDAMANIDRKIHQQLNEIYHHRALQKLEATWRGLHYLIHGKEKQPDIRYRLLSTTKEELRRDFSRSVEFDQSGLFQLIYESEFGTHGGAPFGVLVGDYEFSAKPPDIYLLKNLSAIAAAAHAPMIASASPAMFDMDRFDELQFPKNLKKMFQQKHWKQWQGFRESEDSKYMVLTLPRVLWRLPYGRNRRDRIHPGSLYFEEKVGGVNADKYLWGNAAYVLAARIRDSFAVTGWFFAFRGLGDGTDQHPSGLVTDLPCPNFDAIPIPKMSVDFCMPDQVERQLSELGFISLQHRRWTTDAVFYGQSTTHKPKHYWTKKARIKARLSTMLPHVLMVSRFAHYIKAILRNKIGSFQNRSELNQYLNKWLQKYIMRSNKAGPILKQEFPLYDGKVELFDSSKNPGEYKAIIELTPHLQLEEIVASLQVIANVSKKKP